MKNITSILLCLSIFTLTSCQETPTDNTQQEEPIVQARAKFEPENGKCILFVGQELEAIGGLEAWFIPFFKTIHDNINCHWKSHPMWFETPTFQEVDARLQTNAFISQKWQEETSKDTYLKASPELFDLL